MSSPTLFTRFVEALGVPHTRDYSDAAFRGMTFKSLFGLKHLLREYGIESDAVRVADRSELTKIAVPFLAQTSNGVFVIVKDVDCSRGVVSYDTVGVLESVPIDDFERAWNGIALMAYPTAASAEPDYGSHHLQQVVKSLSRWAMLAVGLFVFVYLFVTRGVGAHWSTVAVAVAVLDCAGLYFSYLLLQKSLGIHTAAADRVCGVLENGGCDSIMSMRVSKLFGVFSWSEVGFGYFGVSLAVLLLFPHLWPYLALCNVCCLPYTVWSIWYQRFRAHRWCTLCVGVQSTLWLLFLSYSCGGWFGGVLPLRFDLAVLVAVYVFAVLFINAVLRKLKNLPKDENNS